MAASTTALAMRRSRARAPALALASALLLAVCVKVQDSSAFAAPRSPPRGTGFASSPELARRATTSRRARGGQKPLEDVPWAALAAELDRQRATSAQVREGEQPAQDGAAADVEWAAVASELAKQAPSSGWAPSGQEPPEGGAVAGTPWTTLVSKPAARAPTSGRAPASQEPSEGGAPAERAPTSRQAPGSQEPRDGAAIADDPWVALASTNRLLPHPHSLKMQLLALAHSGESAVSVAHPPPRKLVEEKQERDQVQPSGQTESHPGVPRRERPQQQEKQQRGQVISAGALAMAAGFFFWYAANVSFNIVNKQALGLFPHAWTVSVIQLATVVACSAVGWATGLVESPFKSMGKGFLWRLLPAAVCHAVGNGLTSVAFSWGSVSFTHVVKTSEPVWMALGNFLVTGAVLPRKQVLALLPVMLGVALASAGELSFTWVGFLAALGSTIAFAGRGIFSKRLMTGGQSMSALNVYAMDSLLALAFTLPVAALMDGPAILSGSLAPVMASQGGTLAGLLAATGLAYYAYNAVAFKLLNKLDVVSHAVGNLGKRIFVILFSVLAFSTPFTARAAAGSALAILGSGVYSYVKATTPKSQSR